MAAALLRRARLRCVLAGRLLRRAFLWRVRADALAEGQLLELQRDPRSVLWQAAIVELDAEMAEVDVAIAATRRQLRGLHSA